MLDKLVNNKGSTMPRYIDRLGKTYGKLTVLAYVGQDAHRKATWLCSCTCLNTTIVSGNALAKGNTKSCGCLQSQSAIKHSRSKTPEYNSWASMRYKCNSPSCKSYKDYGGRGIKVCERWDDFLAFLEDMGEKPSPRHCLTRKNNNLGYFKENCEWAIST